MPSSISEDEFSLICRKYSRQLIREAYRGILLREVDEGGLEHYARKLISGDDLRLVLRSLIESDEHKANITGVSTDAKVDAKDIFNGLLAGDEQRIKGICDLGRDTYPDVFIDPIGVRVSPTYYPWIAERVGSRQTATPIPNDSYFAEGIEYAALALAFQQSKSNEAFTVVEIGAGWGPWVSASAIIARRHGFKSVNLVAFEADEDRYKALRAHLALNGIVEADAANDGKSDTVRWKLLNVAADAENRWLYWPNSGGVEDAGMATVTAPTSGIDYRGMQTTYKKIPARDIRECLNEFSTIDYMHIDIQGAESELIHNTLSFLEERVRCIFIGTHDRKIEGDLISDLRQRGWTLVRERPCQFDLISNAPTLTGMTYVDGGQFWRLPSSY